VDHIHEVSGGKSLPRSVAAVKPRGQLQLHPVIDAVYPFADALAAYDHRYRGAFGKIVIRIKE
jgi:hypothetical protein